MGLPALRHRMGIVMRLVLGALSAALLMGSAPGAHAAADSERIGGCSFAAFQSAVPGWHSGEMDLAAVVYSPTSGNPVSATITCVIRVNGVPQPGAMLAASGTVVVAGASVITYEAAPADVVQLCETVDYTGPGDTTPTEDVCHDIVPLEFPPPCCMDPIDPPICVVLAPLQGTYGPVLVEPEGDVHVNGEVQFDCPPYDEWSLS